MKGSYDLIILLGVELKGECEPTEEMQRRVQTAVQCFREGKAPRILCSGGKLPGKTRSEASVLADLLCRAGVPESALLKEEKSTTTCENILFAREFPEVQASLRVLIVTSDYHLRRAVLTARRYGLRADGCPARLNRSDEWRLKRRKEAAYTLDLLLGWEDPGRTRPAWADRLFAMIFH